MISINEIGELEKSERAIYSAAVISCLKLVQENIPIKEAVEEILKKFETVIKDIQLLRKVLYEEVSQEASAHNIISTEEVRNRKWWDNLKKSEDFLNGYSKRYFDYLSKKSGWSEIAVNDLDKSTDEVMNALADPTRDLADERRGLVYGDVQSGKTAHYMGVINKAFSAGYKIIIVLTGMHNSLRSQTQSRIDEEVLGYETSSLMQYQSMENNIGVGLEISNKAVGFIQSITSRDEHGDFRNSASIGSFMPPYIIVTKKNSSVLRNIINSLSLNTIAQLKDGKKIIPANCPALIIDDEADQASINTKDKDKDNSPSTINGKIRELLNLFECKSYLGYTATPFANIFIPHRGDDDVYGKDLFPKDFIARAPRAHLYVGAKEFFGLDEEDSSMPLVRMISEGKNFLSKGTKKNDSVGELPKELKEAVKHFIISIAVRNLRGQRNKPNTMLVHIGRFVNHQENLKGKIKRYLEEEIINYIEGNDLGVEIEFEHIYKEDFLPTTRVMNAKYPKYSDGCIEMEFKEVWKEIVRLVKANELKIFTINGKSFDNLIYKNFKNKAFNVIAVGGDKLSRGLTLEGLTISYFTRSASAMDTLLQMGRWFGYRPGYLDLCRLFTTEDLYIKFKAISYSAENLASQFDDMNINKSRPDEFGLKVATNPDILISARNKIRTGADYSSDFSNKLTQTRLINAEPEVQESNYQVVDQFLSSLDEYRLDKIEDISKFKYIPAERKEGKVYWVGVPGHRVANFFDAFKTSQYATKASSRLIKDYIDEMLSYSGLVDWTICLAGTVEGNYNSQIATNSKYGPISINGIVRNKEKPVEIDSEKDVDDEMTRDLRVLTSLGDEELDYTCEQITKARELREKYKKETNNHKSIASAVRSGVRDFEHGFLILYPIEWAANDLKVSNNRAPYAFAVVFPDRKNKGVLKQYRLNDVALELDKL